MIQSISSFSQEIFIENAYDIESIIRDYFKEQHAYCLVYQVNKVEIGKVVDGNVILFDKKIDFPYLMEMRVFNTNQELRMIKVQDKWISRLRVDGDGKKKNIYDETHLIWECMTPNNDSSYKIHDNLEWITIEENTGKTLHIPVENLTKDKNIQIVKYHVRNYFKFDDYGRIIFTDARLCDLSID